MLKTKIAVLISGGGTNLQAIIDFAKSGGLKSGELALVVSDKAGAYGVQEWIGYIGVKSISGSFYNIMGLPIQKLYGELKKL